MSDLHEHLSDEIREADTVDYAALAAEIETSRKAYELPTAPDGDAGAWLDRLELCQEAARYVRDGGTIDTDRVVGEA
jgi:hypothetical protein